MGEKRDERVIGVTMIQMYTWINKSFETHCCVSLIWANKACVKQTMNSVSAYSCKHYVLAQLWGRKRRRCVQATAGGTDGEESEIHKLMSGPNVQAEP